METGLRERLPAAAHAAGTDLVIDESFVDLALDGADMPPPVAVFDRHSRVISIGGMSKPYWGGLRIGWIRAAAPRVARLAAARVGVDMASPILDQLVAARLLAHRHTVIEARRKLLAAQRDALVDALRQPRALPPGASFDPPRGGFNLWLELPAHGPTSTELYLEAIQRGVAFVPGPFFFSATGGAASQAAAYGLRLCYSAPSLPDIERGVDLLGQALAALVSPDSGPRPQPVVY
jgi:DNA-binding transcriptional MocR family regulator